MSVVLASLVLAAIFACPCAAMAVERHGCCGDDGARIGPSDCCRAAASPAQWTPRVAPDAAVASLVAVAVPVRAGLPSPSASPSPACVSSSASPPRVLRI